MSLLDPILPHSLDQYYLPGALALWCAVFFGLVALWGYARSLRGDESDRLPAEAAAAYLSRYGIHAEVEHVALDGAKVGDVLFERVSSGHFGYVVMGGFGHHRVAEALFGGVTRMMLTKSPVPIFLAH